MAVKIDVFSLEKSLMTRDVKAEMYNAAHEGNWNEARNLAIDCINAGQDTALHVAVANEHEEFVIKIIQWIDDTQYIISMLDCHGYTACCSLVKILVAESADVITYPGKDNVTPLKIAATFRNKVMFQYLLHNAKVDKQSNAYWMDIVLELIRVDMIDVILEMVHQHRFQFRISEVNAEGTILRALARLIKPDAAATSFFNNIGRKSESLNFKIRRLAEFVWSKMSRMENVYDLIKKPNSVHHVAASMVNTFIINMMTKTFSSLIWLRDDKGHTIFHVAVMYRKTNILELAPKDGSMKVFSEIKRDAQGNTILNLAAMYKSI